jgi:hypothetical protein
MVRAFSRRNHSGNPFQGGMNLSYQRDANMMLTQTASRRYLERSPFHPHSTKVIDQPIISFDAGMETFALGFVS